MIVGAADEDDAGAGLPAAGHFDAAADVLAEGDGDGEVWLGDEFAEGFAAVEGVGGADAGVGDLGEAVGVAGGKGDVGGGGEEGLEGGG